MSRIFHHLPLVQGFKHAFGSLGERNFTAKALSPAPLLPAHGGLGLQPKGRAAEVSKGWFPQNISSPCIPISLNSLKSLVNEVMDSISHGIDQLQEDLAAGSSEEMLKKLVVERLMGGEIKEVTINGAYSRSEAANVSAVAVSAFSLDLEIDYKGALQWQGGAAIVEGHIEIHLEHVEVSAVSWSSSSGNGLSRLNDTTVDTGRYLLHWENMTTFSIYDKHSKLSTTIWGDPHVDLSDVQGMANGEFSDLTKSDMITVMELLDGTKVVITAPDTGVIQKVDVIKGGEHVEGVGFPEKFFNSDGTLRQEFVGQVETRGSSRFQVGGFFKEVERYGGRGGPGGDQPVDYVKVGGDGNDWFDENGNLIWGG